MFEFTQQQIRFWKENSYLLLPGFCSDRRNQLSQWVGEIGSWPKDSFQWMSFYERDNISQLSRIENFIQYHPKIADVIIGDMTIDLISRLMGEPALLYKERINFKYPGGGAHEAHQDGVAYEKGGGQQFDPHVVPYISILISVDHATPENGCLEVVPNWNLDRLDILPMEAPISYMPQYTKIAQDVEDALEWIKIPTEPGDVILFTERLPHRSAANASRQTRRVVYGVYNPQSEGDLRDAYYQRKRENLDDPRYLVGNPHALTSQIA